MFQGDWDSITARTWSGCRIVDLGALEAVGVVHVDGFPFGVKIDGGDATNAAVAVAAAAADGCGVKISTAACDLN
jgi:hypothetical protein